MYFGRHGDHPHWKTRNCKLYLSTSVNVKTGSLKKLLFKNGFYTKFVFKANFMVVWGGGLGTNFGF